METTASSGGERASTRTTNQKEPTGSVSVPLTEINTIESISLGFRSNLFEIVDDDKTILGSMDSTAIGGGDALILQWGKGDDKKQVFIRGRDLFAAWVKQFDPEAAKKLPGVRYAS